MEEMVNLSFYRGKKVFITGHTGFKGSWLSKILIMSGAKVFGYSLEPSTNPNLFNLIGLEKQINSYIGDIRDLASLTKAIEIAQPEIVFHLAAQPIVRESYVHPVDTYSTNVMGTVNILEACRTVKSVKSIINVTTDKVYENKEWSWGYRENENLCGYDPYSNSKSCSELVTFSYKNSFFNGDSSPSISTARSGNVIGGGDFSADRIIPDCVRATIKGDEIIVRNPYSTRPYQHVLECLRGYLTLAIKQYDKNIEGNYNFGPNECDCVTTGQIVELFCENWQGAKWIECYDGGPHEANFLKLDCSKAKDKLRWYPKWNVIDAVNNTVKWYEVYSKNGDLIAITEKQIKEYFNI